LYRRAVEQIRVLPGVESVSFGLTMPFGEGTHSISIPHPASLSPESDEPGSVMIGCNGVGVDYFRTLGVPLLRGRDFTRAEVESTNAPRVAIVSQVFADLFWPGEYPVGKRLQFTPFPTDSSDVSMEVVGVVPHLKQDLMENRRNPFLYLPYGQAYQPDILLHVRLTAGTDSAFLMRQTRDALRRLEPLLPVTALKTLRASHETGGKMGALRVGAWLFGAFGLVALLLAAIGIYGVNAYSVARRTREIGIRMALGASAGNVLRMVLFEGARLTAIGLGFGLLLSAAVERLASGFLYGVVSLDLVAFTIAPALLALSALFACWLPAHRAARVDPMEALRTE
jgi:putative ABC transport system permease protein